MSLCYLKPTFFCFRLWENSVTSSTHNVDVMGSYNQLRYAPTEIKISVTKDRLLRCYDIYRSIRYSRICTVPIISDICRLLGHKLFYLFICYPRINYDAKQKIFEIIYQIALYIIAITKWHHLIVFN